MKKWLGLLLLLLPLLVWAQQTGPLLVDQAFSLSIRSVQQNQVDLHWQIAPGYHLYKDRFAFSIANPADAKINQPIVLPPGIPKQDAILGNYDVYTGSLDISLPIAQLTKKAPIVLVTYQGCADSNFCYPPTTKRITVHFEDVTQTTIQTHEANLTTQDKITDLLKQKNYFWICLAFMGFGLLLAFTPCVLPMIPILSGIIVGQDNKNLSTRRAFFLSLAYVIGMSITYAIAGILVAMAGNSLGAAFQAPWVIVLFSALFVVLALSLFDWYELRLPHFLQHPVIHLSNRQRSGSYIGAAVMGALSVLIVSPCVTAPLVGVLSFIAQTGNIVLGSTALFTLGVGMGIPLLIIGTSEGKWMPKKGPWMHNIKAGFGVLLLGVAIYLLARIIPGYIALMLWAVLFIILAVYLGVGDNHALTHGRTKFAKGMGYLVFAYGMILLIGAAQGNSDPLQPLASQQNMLANIGNTGNANRLAFQPIKNIADVNAVLANAQRANKFVMLDFFAEWCVSCHEMDRTTFADPGVVAALNNMIVIRADVTANDATDKALEKYFNVIAPPTMLFFGPDGKELADSRLVGASPPAAFMQHLANISSKPLQI